MNRLTYLSSAAFLAAISPLGAAQDFDALPSNAKLNANTSPGFIGAPSNAMSLTFYADRPIFQIANPGLPLEDYSGGSTIPGDVIGCNPPVDENSNDSCFSPGDIMPGVSLDIEVNGGGGEAVVVNNAFGLTCVAIGPNSIIDDARFNFDPAVAAVGLDLYAPLGDYTQDVEIFNGNGISLGTTTVSVTAAGQFFGVDTDDPAGIGSILFVDQVAGDAELFCDVEYGGTVSACTPGSLSTTMASNNGGSTDWMTLKDINVVNPNGIDITGFDINDNNGGLGGSPVEIDIYTTPGGLAGKETDPAQWTLVATGSATAMPENTATFVDTSDFFLPPGLWGIGIHYRVGAGPAYTNGNGTNESYSNCDIDLDGCCSIAGLFTGTVFSPRIFNGAVYTCAVAYGGRTYCTAKKNSCGTTPFINGSGTPSSSAISGHFIRGANANNNKSGLLLYSNGGAAALPFQGGTLCVAPSIRRTPPTFSGGSTGCDGVFAIDMNEFASGNGGGNPQPFLLNPGQNVHCQWWGRDSVGNGSYLSDGLNYCVGL